MTDAPPPVKSVDWSSYFHELSAVRAMVMEATRELASLRTRQDAFEARHRDLTDSIRVMASTVDKLRETLDLEIRNVAERLTASQIENERNRSKMFFAIMIAATGAIGSLVILIIEYLLNAA